LERVKRIQKKKNGSKKANAKEIASASKISRWQLHHPASEVFDIVLLFHRALFCFSAFVGGAEVGGTKIRRDHEMNMFSQFFFDWRNLIVLSLVFLSSRLALTPK
jgi:hypothetical protein